MALEKNMPLHDVVVYAYLASVTDASSAYVAAPCKGRIVEVGSTLYAAITTADDAITTSIGATAITGGAFTIAFTGAAAGDTDSATPTGANVVNKGSIIRFASDGASDTAAPAMFYAIIRRDI